MFYAIYANFQTYHVEDLNEPHVDITTSSEIAMLTNELK